MITAGMLPGKVEAAKFRLAGSANRVRGAIPDALREEAINLVVCVKLKLSDDVLHVRTGRLRRSITYRMEQHGETFQAQVGTNVKYARAHELGFSGSVNVPQHTVKEFSRMQSVAFGRPMKEPRKVNVREHVVKAHAMKMNIPAKPFLKPSLQENETRIKTNLRKAIAQAMK